MKLEPLLDYHLNIGAAIEVGGGPYGDRTIVETPGGEFAGPRLRGTIRTAGGADWLTMGEDYAYLDVRCTFVTDDGANIFVEYTGASEMTAASQAALAGEGGTDFGDAYLFTRVRFQTGDERYRWLNNLVCIGQGRLLPGRVEYRVCYAAND